jgi:hypothetical protein
MERTRSNASTLIYLWYGGLALAAVLRVGLIDRHGLWNNELITFNVLHLPYWDLLHERLGFNHMPLYFLMEKAWTDVFGTSEASMRSVGAFFGWMAVWATGRLARRIGGLGLGVLVVFAASIQQLWLSTSLEARMYSMVTWAAAESTDAYFAMARAEQRGERRATWWAMGRWIPVTVIGIHAHMLHGAVLAIQMLDAVGRRFLVRMPLKSIAASWMAAAVLCIPISVAWFMNQSKVGDERSLNFRAMGLLTRQMTRAFVGDYRTVEPGFLRPMGYVSAQILFVAALAGMIFLLRAGRGGSQAPARVDGEGRRDLKSLGFMVLAFLAGMYVAQAASSSGLIGTERYFAGVFPAVMVLGVGAVLRLGDRWPRAGGALLGLLLATQALMSAGYYHGMGDGLREAVEAMRQGDGPQRGFVTVASSAATYGLGDYYGADLKDRMLTIQRETEPRVMRERMRQFSERYPEFWVLRYRERRDAIQRVLNDPDGPFVALTDEADYGKATLQLYGRRGGEAAGGG